MWVRAAPIRQASRDHVRREWSSAGPWGLFAEPAIQDGSIGIDAAITKEWPIATRIFAFGGVALDDEDFFFIVGRFGDDFAEKVGDGGVAPEFEAGVVVGGDAL